MDSKCAQCLGDPDGLCRRCGLPMTQCRRNELHSCFGGGTYPCPRCSPNSVRISPQTAAALSTLGLGDVFEVETPERMAWICGVLRYVPDTPQRFPKGKWATIQALQEQVDNAFRRAAAGHQGGMTVPLQSQTSRPWAKHRGEREWLDDLERRLAVPAGSLEPEALIAIRYLRERLAQVKQDLAEEMREGQRAARDAFAEGRWAEREEG